MDRTRASFLIILAELGCELLLGCLLIFWTDHHHEMTEMTYEMAQNTLKRKPQTPSHPPDPRSVLQVGPGSYGGSIPCFWRRLTMSPRRLGLVGMKELHSCGFSVSFVWWDLGRLILVYIYIKGQQHRECRVCYIKIKTKNKQNQSKQKNQTRKPKATKQMRSKAQTIQNKTKLWTRQLVILLR